MTHPPLHRGARLPIGRAPGSPTNESVSGSGARSRADEMRFFSVLGYMAVVAMQRSFDADAREARARESAATARTHERTMPASLAAVST